MDFMNSLETKDREGQLQSTGILTWNQQGIDSRASERPFCTLGEIVNFAPPIYVFP